jgi:hypothetical protein
MTLKISGLSCLVLWALALSQTVFAQEVSGTITGTLLDPSGKVVTGLAVPVQLKNTATGDQFTSTVSDNGTYALTRLPAGSYDLNVPMACCMYRTYQQKSVTLTAGQTLHLDFHVEWGINLGTIGDDPVMLNDDMRRKAKNVSGPAPRMPDGKPDFSGMWVPVADPGNPQPRIPLQPWAADMQKKLQESGANAQNAAAYCLPQSAVPTTNPFDFKLVQNASVIVHMTEFTTPGYRQIFIDGRSHPNDWNPAWMGHSTGKWDGDTLVVDTVGFNEVTPGYGIHTEKLHVVERFQRPDKAHLEVDITAEDPDAYTAPFTRKVRAALVPDEEILEFVCAENNKDPLHFGGLGWKGRP